MIAPSQKPVIVCATARLAHNVRLQLVQDQIASGQQQWQVAEVYTLQQWLQKVTDFICLVGDVPADHFSPNVLDPFAETLLWQQAIQAQLAKHTYAALFDMPSLAKTAASANQLLISWAIDDSTLQRHAISTETKQFCQWRQRFLKLCAQYQATTPAQHMTQQLVAIAGSDYPLPAQMTWLGFDRITPQEQAILNVLASKGCVVSQAGLPAATAQLAQIGLNDWQAECRAAVAWAKQHLQQNPACNLAIISPIQTRVRRLLSDLLDDTFHPHTRHAAQYETARIYDFSAGQALSEHAMCRTALLLLRLTQNGSAANQTDFSALLLDVYWGKFAEQAMRAQVDAHLRRKLLRNVHLTQVIDLVGQYHAASQLLVDLKTMVAYRRQWTRPLLPSAWAEQFSALLDTLSWANTRTLSSHEYQAKQAWQQLLNQLATLDMLTGKVNAQEAIHQLNALAGHTMFLPEASRDVRIQLLGMLENLARPVDAIWVMAMNDHIWPPPTNLNPLLPINLQRQAHLPGADADTQTAFAQTIHQRLCNSARELVFSWSHKEGERLLRASPLLHDIPVRTTAPASLQTLSEKLAQPKPLQRLADHLAPVVTADEKLRGGSHLLQAQAICPAWAFYQYRLGAQALEEPSDGLDSMTRGNLVHVALQSFWLDCRDRHTLQSWDDATLNTQVGRSVAQALDSLDNPMPAALVRIEQARLQSLLLAWLQLEKSRENFSVAACEAQYTVTLAGLSIDCRIDRIDTLDDQSLLVIDYKTGASQLSVNRWSSDRIKEPQLPLYASIALKNEPVAAVCFAKVHADECKFIGLTQDAVLPQVSPVDKLAVSSAFNGFTSMQAVISHWRNCLEKTAQEIQQGVAGVFFEKEEELMYCPVKPLLRLAERQLQFETLPDSPSDTKDRHDG